MQSYTGVPNLPEGALDSPMSHETSFSPGQPLSAEQPPPAAPEMQATSLHR